MINRLSALLDIADEAERLREKLAQIVRYEPEVARRHGISAAWISDGMGYRSPRNDTADQTAGGE